MIEIIKNLIFTPSSRYPENWKPAYLAMQLGFIAGGFGLLGRDIIIISSIEDWNIIIFSEIKINEEITKTKLDKVIKRLYKTSFFKDINLSFENQTLFLKVEENPIIEKLEITGIKKQSLVEFIKDKLQLAEMKSFDQNLLSSDINLIYNILKRLRFKDIS